MMLWEKFKSGLLVLGVVALFFLTFIFGFVEGASEMESKQRKTGVSCDFCGQRKKSFHVFLVEKSRPRFGDETNTAILEFWVCDKCHDSNTEGVLRKLAKLKNKNE